MKHSLIFMLFFFTAQIYAVEQAEPEQRVEVAQEQQQVQQRGCGQTIKRGLQKIGQYGGMGAVVASGILALIGAAAALPVFITGVVVAFIATVSRYKREAKEFLQKVGTYVIKTLQHWGQQISRVFQNIFNYMYQNKLARQQAWADFWKALKACQCGPACTSLVKLFSAVIRGPQSVIFLVGFVFSIIGSIHLPKLEWYVPYTCTMVVLGIFLDVKCVDWRGGDQPSLEDGLAQGVRSEETHNAPSIQGTIGREGLDDDEIAFVESLRSSTQSNGVANTFFSNFGGFANNTSRQTPLLSETC